MNLIEIYDSIENPIQNINVLKTILKEYTNTEGSFYDRITRILEKDYSKPSNYQESVDFFYASMFNDWKKSIVKFNQIEDDKLNAEFMELRHYLRNIPDVATKDQAYEILNGKNVASRLRKILKKFRWDRECDGYWSKLYSRTLDVSGSKLERQDNSLHINIDPGYIYQFATILKRKYDEHRIPFSFKFNAEDNRDDCFVIYTNNQYLLENLKILREIEKEWPLLKEHVRKPTILLGVLDGWIGYADEVTNNQATKESYNIHRVKILKKAIDALNADLAINCDNAGDYYTEIQKNINEYVKHQINTLVLNKFKVWKKRNRLTIKELNSDSFYNALFSVTEKYIYDELDRIKTGAEPKDGYIKCNFNNKEVKLQFKASNTDLIMRHLANISEKLPNFFDLLQQKIKKYAKEFGVDENKFCFEATSIEKMKTIDSIRKINLCISILKLHGNEDIINQLSESLEGYLKEIKLDSKVQASYNLENMSKEEIKSLEKESFEFISLMLCNEGKMDLCDNLNSFIDIYFNNSINETEVKPQETEVQSQETEAQPQETEVKTQETEVQLQQIEIKPQGKRTYSIKDDFIINSITGEIIDLRNYTEFEKIVFIEYLDECYDYQQDEAFIYMMQEYIKDIIQKISDEENPNLTELRIALEQESTRTMIEETLNEVIVEDINQARISIKEKSTQNENLSFEEMKFAANNFQIIKDNDNEIVYDVITGEVINNPRTITVVKNAQLWIAAVGVESDINKAFSDEYKKIFNFIKLHASNEDDTTISSEQPPLSETLETEYKKINRNLINFGKGNLKKFFSLNLTETLKVKNKI